MSSVVVNFLLQVSMWCLSSLWFLPPPLPPLPPPPPPLLLLPLPIYLRYCGCSRCLAAAVVELKEEKSRFFVREICLVSS